MNSGIFDFFVSEGHYTLGLVGTNASVDYVFAHLQYSLNVSTFSKTFCSICSSVPKGAYVCLVLNTIIWVYVVIRTWYYAWCVGFI